MGLDMYGFKAKAKPKTKVDFDCGDDDPEVFYWRKHPDLHGWMEKLYRKHKGEDDEFNGSCLLLEEQDLSDLEAALEDGALPRTSGFFFGSSYGDEDELKRDLGFIAKAREAIADGCHLYYFPSW